MHCYILTARPLPGAGGLNIARFIRQHRPRCRSRCITGMLIETGGVIHTVLEGPEDALEDLSRDLCASPCFESACMAGKLQTARRTLIDVPLAYAEARHLSEDTIRALGQLPGLQFLSARLAA